MSLGIIVIDTVLATPTPAATPTAYTLGMEQVATYWAPGVNDGYGELDFSLIVPVLIYCRWQEAAQLFIDAQGREIRGNAIVYPANEVELGGYLFLGDAGVAVGGDPRSVDGAWEIRQIGTSPSLLADEVLYKVWL